MVKKKVLEHLIDYLVDNKFDTFFLVTGGAIVPTVDYIGRKKGATYYCFQHEQSAAMAAESFYRTSGKMGVVLTTSGPGAQNLSINFLASSCPPANLIPCPNNKSGLLLCLILSIISLYSSGWM